jgi:hypothetical protein
MELKSEVKNLAGEAKAQASVVGDKLQGAGEDLRVELDDLLGSLSEKVADMRATLATAAEDGAETVGKGVNSMVKKTRKGIKDLDKRWKKLDGKQKIAIAGGLLAVLAAAAVAPTVVRKLRASR